MTQTGTHRVVGLAITLTLAAGSVGCSRHPEVAGEVPAAGPAAPREEPTYVPAYPPEVSSEGLSEQDVAQQSQPHTHADGEEHTHAEKDEEGDHGHPH